MFIKSVLSWVSLLGLLVLVYSFFANDIRLGRHIAEHDPIRISSKKSPSSDALFRPDRKPTMMSPYSEDGIQIILATTDLSLGENRIAFSLVSKERLIRVPTAKVSSYHRSDLMVEMEHKQDNLAVFRPFPYYTRGIYTSRLIFDVPGRWIIDVGFIDEGTIRRAQLFFDVETVSRAPAVGTFAIKSYNKIASDVHRLAQLTSGKLRDPDLYRVTIADAVENGLPTVVVMASPAFCVNAVCGPQVEVLHALKNEFKGQANFIHVDFYDNPETIQGDMDKAILSPVIVEWNLPSPEWTFVIDKFGIVIGRFEAFVPLEELRVSLQKAL